MVDGRLQLVPERRAPHGEISGLLRASSSRRRPSHARWAGSAAANSPARRVAREFMPNTEPVARGRRAATAGIDHQVQIGRRCAASPPAARQLPRGQRRWPRRSGRPHSERARARACRLTAGASRPSRGERRPWSSKIQLARALTSASLRRRRAAHHPTDCSSPDRVQTQSPCLFCACWPCSFRPY